MTTFNITVGIPTYNAAETLAYALDSINAQTAGKPLVVIVDDASTDDTLSLLEAYQRQWGDRLTVLRHEVNRGEAVTRNTVLAHITTPWLLWLDADDCLTPDLLSTYCNRLRQSYNHPTLIYPDYQQIDREGHKLGQPLVSSPVPPADVLGTWLLRNRIASPSGVLVSTAALRAINGFDESLTLSPDWDLWLRLAKAGYSEFLYQPGVGVLLRRHEDNLSARLPAMLAAELHILQRWSLSGLQQAVTGRSLSQTQNAIDWASLLLRLGHHQQAQTVLNEVKVPSANLCFYQGILGLHIQDWLLAERCFEQATRQDNAHIAARQNLAGVWWELGYPTRTLQQLQLLCKEQPAFVDAQHNLRRLLDNTLKSGEYQWTWRECRPNLVHYLPQNANHPYNQACQPIEKEFPS